MLRPFRTFGCRGLIASLALALFLTFNARAPKAQSPDPAQMMQLQQVPLTKAKVDGFLGSLPEFNALGKKYDKDGASEAGPMDSASRLFQYQAAHAEMQKVLKAHGFSSFPEWVKVAQTVAITYSFVRSGDGPGQLAPQAQKALDEIDKDPNMSVEQKAQIKAMMQQQMAMAKRLQPLPENVSLVKSMLPQISKVLDAE